MFLTTGRQLHRLDVKVALVALALLVVCGATLGIVYVAGWWVVPQLDFELGAGMAYGSSNEIMSRVSNLAAGLIVETGRCGKEGSRFRHSDIDRGPPRTFDLWPRSQGPRELPAIGLSWFSTEALHRRALNLGDIQTVILQSADV